MYDTQIVINKFSVRYYFSTLQRTSPYTTHHDRGVPGADRAVDKRYTDLSVYREQCVTSDKQQQTVLWTNGTHI